jgi:hypothetical protein
MYLLSDKNLLISCGILVSGSLLFGLYVIFNIFSTNLNVEIKSDVDIYIDNKEKLFFLTFNNTDGNKNIDPIFYDNNKYSDVIQLKNNILETSWKQRILFENTPNGNVIMFFDAYKMAFAYYSDVIIPYHILNGVAMKYVATFLCRDFFLDKSIIPSDNKTPFQYIHEIDIKKENKKKINVSKGPFAKLKSYSKEKEDKNVEKEKNIDAKKSDADKQLSNYIKNKFINKGKIRDLDLLQNKRVKDFKKELKPISYSSFKQWHNPVKDSEF